MKTLKEIKNEVAQKAYKKSWEYLTLAQESFVITVLCEQYAESKCAELERELSEANRWKSEATELLRQWDDVDEAVRQSDDCIIGDSVSKKALEFVKERHLLKSQLSEAKSEVERLNKVSEWNFSILKASENDLLEAKKDLSEAREREEAFAIKFAEWILDQNFRYYGTAFSTPPTAFAYKQHPDGKSYRMTELVALFRSSLTSKSETK
jgi:hypothetical protein